MAKVYHVHYAIRTSWPLLAAEFRPGSAHGVNRFLWCTLCETYAGTLGNRENYVLFIHLAKVRRDRSGARSALHLPGSEFWTRLPVSVSQVGRTGNEPVRTRPIKNERSAQKLSFSIENLKELHILLA